MLANRLTHITIQFISLVPAGANRREFTAKGEGLAGMEIEARIVKLDDELRQVSGALYPAGQVDTQGDFVTQADWDLAMHDFMKAGRTAAGQACDLMHDGRATADYIVECFKIGDGGDPRFEGEEPGTWIVTRQVTDDTVWQLVKGGTFRAFSFGGTAMRIPDQIVTKAEEPTMDKSVLKKLAETIAALFAPLVEDAPEGAELSLDGVSGATPATKADEPQEDAAQLVAAAKAELETAHAAAIEALKAEHAAQLAELTEKIEALEKQTPDSGRHDHNGTGDGGVSGGAFAGRVR